MQHNDFIFKQTDVWHIEVIINRDDCFFSITAIQRDSHVLLVSHFVLFICLDLGNNQRSPTERVTHLLAHTSSFLCWIHKNTTHDFFILYLYPSLFCFLILSVRSGPVAVFLAGDHNNVFWHHQVSCSLHLCVLQSHHTSRATHWYRPTKRVKGFNQPWG